MSNNVISSSQIKEQSNIKNVITVKNVIDISRSTTVNNVFSQIEHVIHTDNNDHANCDNNDHANCDNNDHANCDNTDYDCDYTDYDYEHYHDYDKYNGIEYVECNGIEYVECNGIEYVECNNFEKMLEANNNNDFWNDIHQPFLPIYKKKQSICPFHIPLINYTVNRSIKKSGIAFWCSRKKVSLKNILKT